MQFRDELITKKFPPESGCAATYHFTIEGEVPKPLQVVIERPDLYAIACNGKPLAPEKGSWWLDKSFGRIDITAAAKTGANEVTIRARPFTVYHELAAAYVLGDFGLKAAGAGFTIATRRAAEARQMERAGTADVFRGGSVSAESSTCRSPRDVTSCDCRPGTAAWRKSSSTAARQATSALPPGSAT